MEKDGELGLIKEFIDGKTLARLLNEEATKNSPLAREALARLNQLLQALCAYGLYLSDLHYENLIYEPEKKLWYIVDFGSFSLQDSPEAAAFSYFKGMPLMFGTDYFYTNILFRRHVLDPLAAYLRAKAYSPYLLAQELGEEKLSPKHLESGFDPNAPAGEARLSPLARDLGADEMAVLLHFGGNLFQPVGQEGEEPL